MAEQKTKLEEWLFAIGLCVSIWLGILLGLVPLPDSCYYIALGFPVYIVVGFGVYSLVVIVYRVATFTDCPEAAAELEQQIKEAREDLKRKGYEFS